MLKLAQLFKSTQYKFGKEPTTLLIEVITTLTKNAMNRAIIVSVMKYQHIELNSRSSRLHFRERTKVD